MSRASAQSTSTSAYLERSARFFHAVGAPVLENLELARELARLQVGVLRIFFGFRWRWKEIIQAMQNIGVGSLWIVTIATAFAGLVVTNEIAWHLNQALNTIAMMPGFTGQFIMRELAIAIPAFLVISKVGASITAEVGSMKVTEQIDALKLLRIDPIAYLVFPRWLACSISLACLTLIAVAVTQFFAIVMAVSKYGFNTLEYLNNFRHFVKLIDLGGCVVKSLIYGAVIPLISCAYGFRCKGGAQGVGNATTNSVVTSTITVIVLDFFLTYLFTKLL
ncbi:MAG: MlaE family ABC transporter permease [Bacteriovoracia bacterium]